MDQALCPVLAILFQQRLISYTAKIVLSLLNSNLQASSIAANTSGPVLEMPLQRQVAHGYKSTSTTELKPTCLKHSCKRVRGPMLEVLL